MPAAGTDMVRLSFLQWLEAEESNRQQKYRTFRDYYEGQHETQLTPRQRKFLELRSGQEFNLNFCPIVVDSLAEKLKVTGFSCDDKPEVLWDWWQKARMDAVQAIFHLSACRDGDTYLLTEWDKRRGRPTWTHENAYDGTEGMQVVYSDERRTEPLVAIKKWLVTSGPGAAQTRRANLYFPHEICKYVSQDGAAWQPYVAREGDYAGVWPIPWTRKGEPMGIPVVHFRNKDTGYGYGESELEDVVSPQNLLNKSAIDLVAAADTTAFQRPWMTGGKPESTGMGIGSWWYHTNSEARVGVLEAGNIAGLIALKDSVAADIAKITRTPLSYFQISGQTPAEGSQKQQESGLVSKAEDRQNFFGNQWEDAEAMGRKLFNEFGPGGLDEEATISTLWEDAEERNEKEHLEGLKVKKDLGVPQERLWQEMGYDADTIAKLWELKAQEDARGMSSLAQGVLAGERGFNAGE